MHLPSHIRAVTELDPSSGAVQYRATWHTWGELAAIRDTLDTVLTERGIVPGMPVGVVARNRPHVIAAILGLFCTNRAVVVVNSMLPAAAVEDDVYNLRLPALIADPSDWARGDLIETARSVSTVGIRVPDQCDAKPTFVDGLEHGTTEDRFVVRVGTAACMLTSGTTGPPKRVAISYRNFEQALDAHAHYGNGFGSARLSNAVNILSVPPVNITGMWQLITSVVLGRRVALLEKFNVSEWVALVKEHQLRAGRLPPAAVKMVLDAKVDPLALRSLKAIWTGGAPLNPEVGRQFEERYGVPVLQSYGSTEFTGGVAGWTLRDWHQWKDQKRGSVGRPNPGVEIRAVDPRTGDPVPRGSVGIITIRSPQSVGAGPTEWVRTTDLGRVDEDGFVWIEGRVDDVINRGGFKIVPAAVEEVLARHPFIQEAAVVGLPDPRLGQVPGALIVLRPGAPEPEPGELARLVKEYLPPYCAPVRYRVVSELPRNASLKVIRSAARDLLGEADRS